MHLPQTHSTCNKSYRIRQENKSVRHTVAHCRVGVTPEATLKGEKPWTMPTQAKHTATFPSKVTVHVFLLWFFQSYQIELKEFAFELNGENY